MFIFLPKMFDVLGRRVLTHEGIKKMVKAKIVRSKIRL